MTLRIKFFAITLLLLLMIVSLLSYFTGCSTKVGEKYEPVNRRMVNHLPVVLSRHRLAREAGYRILKAGGNAFDAFVAVAVVENVVSSGYVTFAGLLSVLLFHAESGQTMYLDAGFNSVLNPKGVFDSDKPCDGKKVVVPGVVAGLETLSKRFGRLSFSEVLQPALEIARDGFAVDEAFVSSIMDDKEKLQRSAYGRLTFFPGGKAIQVGNVLKQPQLADTLANLAKQGAAYMYSGQWAIQCIRTVQKEGGLMTLQDLASYSPTWSVPWKIPYRGFDIYSSSGRCLYGLWVLMALKTLEHTDIQKMGHFSTSAKALEILVRIVQTIYAEKWIRDYRILDNRILVNSRLTHEYTKAIWVKVMQKVKEKRETVPLGNCTLSSVVADRNGNVVSGKHSINSEMWGNGLFVGGVLLNGSGDMLGRYTGPGQRRTQGAPNFIIFKKGVLKFAGGTFSFSNPQAAFQLLVNLLDYRLSPREAVGLPRFGSYPYDMKTGHIDLTKYDLDERFGGDIVTILKNYGISFNQSKPKLGKGCIVEFFSNGSTASGWDWGI